jgi:hypothetical protein
LTPEEKEVCSIPLTSLHKLTSHSQPYKRRSAVLKEARERENAAYMKSLTPDDIKKENAFRTAQRKAGRSRKSNIKDPNAPKKPLSAYFMFLQRIRSDPALVREIFGDEQETTKQSVLAAAKWRSMTDDERKVRKNLCHNCVISSSHFSSLSLRKPSRRSLSTRLHVGCTRKAPLILAQVSISASCQAAPAVRVHSVLCDQFKRSRSVQKARARA